MVIHGSASSTTMGRRRSSGRSLALITLLALLAGACTGAAATGAGASTPVAAATGAVGSTSAPTPAETGAVGSPIPQLSLPGNVPVAPDSQRVDLTVPRFSNPTNVTNPLFPVSEQRSVVFVGHVDGKPFRTEVTLLPFTRVIEWGGQQIETLVSQYVAYLDGRLQEVAYDLYAQADDGSVWYFGEDVADLANGVVVTKEGTWLAGKDGPAQMIMPAQPEVGDAFRTENIPGIAFEQVTVESVDRTLRGPLGPIPGGMVGKELHMDGSSENKLFGPGYGEFFTGGGGDVEALALAVATDAADQGTPADLTTMQAGATRIIDAGRHQDWKADAATVGRMKKAWTDLRTSEVPWRLEPEMSGALDALAKAVEARDVPATRQAAIDADQWILDLELRYRPPAEIDLARFDLWAAQLLVDADAGDAADVNGDVFTLFYIRDRILSGLSPAERTGVNVEIGRLQIAGEDGAIARAARTARKLRAVVAGIQAGS